MRAEKLRSGCPELTCVVNRSWRGWPRLRNEKVSAPDWHDTAIGFALAALGQQFLCRIVKHRAERRDHRAQRVDQMTFGIRPANRHVELLGQRRAIAPSALRRPPHIFSSPKPEEMITAAGMHLRAALLDGRDHMRGGHDDHREVDCFRQVGDRAVGLVAEDFALAARRLGRSARRSRGRSEAAWSAARADRSRRTPAPTIARLFGESRGRRSGMDQLLGHSGAAIPIGRRRRARNTRFVETPGFYAHLVGQPVLDGVVQPARGARTTGPGGCCRP